jgi:hypothetical protein
MQACKMFAAAMVAGATLMISSPSFSFPAMEIRAEDLMSQSADLKQSLNLNANQQVLWQQVESKARALLRVRQSRREHLQADLKSSLADVKTELRDLSGAFDVENMASAQEDKQLREWWLTVNDALDDTQRRIVLVFLADQLQRVAGVAHEDRPAHTGSEKHSRGMGKSGGAHGGGMSPF